MTKALIVGGGIAGPVTAVALRRLGMDVTLSESFPRGAHGVGAFLGLAANGVDALRAVDLGHVVDGLGFATPAMDFYSGTGRHWGRLPLGNGRGGTTTQTMRRSDLYAALADAALQAGVNVQYGKRLVDTRTEADGVRAIFADGTEEVGDLLVGADGVRSRTRELIDPEAPQPRYLGLGNAGGFAQGVDVPGEVGVMQMMFGHDCFFSWTKNPNGEVWWFANTPAPRELSREELAAISSEEWRENLIGLVARDRSPAKRIIRATEDVLAGWNTYDLPTVPTWHSGRTVLVGDSVHAMSPASGQGASMAMEDAVVLAQCLRDSASIEDAFTTYEATRRDRVEKVVAFGKRSGDQKAVGSFGRIVRDLTYPFVLNLVARGQAREDHWLYTHHIEWESPARTFGYA
ncbi:FAD-dependent monooxygenase [Spiractinospora alimapuensis]|uniref:FAD-dependent monooxygenase n=1 Tax=Spiractinospora alimapuensis TaxID=2820884 RepID=UPI001F3662C5|nr:FAD-dependent monooxygenase [Spiractinospora alimapuensis]QVQ50125.1 FAD-dependent monooxygenase [Spiractinospora alimapuensis]